MGNKTSTGNEPTLASYSHRDEMFPTLPQPNRNLSRTSPSPTFPKRSFTVSERHKVPEVYLPVPPIPRTGSDSSAHRSSLINPLLLSQSENLATSDDLSKHVLDTTPKEGEGEVSLGAHITAIFDKDVRTVSTNKLFEVTCDSIDPALNPIKGHASYDTRHQKVAFTPVNTFLPNAQYTVVLKGTAVTTAQCSQGTNIEDKQFRFHTCNPPPKSVGIKLKGQFNSEQLQIASYYDLYNSLILWCTKKWGCSGEHITAVYSEKEGKMVAIKGDLDVLNVNEREVIVVEIKD